MADSDERRSTVVEYRITIPVVLAFVAFMLSIYLLGQNAYRYNSGRVAIAETVFAEAETPSTSHAPVAAAVSTSK